MIKSIEDIKNDKLLLEDSIRRAVNYFMRENPGLIPDIDIRIIDASCKGSGPESICSVKSTVSL